MSVAGLVSPALPSSLLLPDVQALSVSWVTGRFGAMKAHSFACKTNRFWGSNFDPIPRTALYPKGDKIQAICSEIGEEVKKDLQPGQIGEFLKSWAEIETYLIKQADMHEQRGSPLEAIRRLRRLPDFNDDLFFQIDRLRRFRNQLVHSPVGISQEKIRNYLEVLDQVSATIKSKHIR